ncbi:NADPH-dependent FMN reductase [Halogeometricum sp. CBA1124]|uniref:NADPH-dependent FMN reductase n=1 Tax=Halogeometricum sp. CBA1124 TaxID=2668071 RepID=UPI00142BC650|nr:NAD(P)H-dependent oxidoreductase [Halogeometricum sp. CBA1124]MUV57201.1 NADPH-dependent oxidoreductase [Halogeometricum sp. CBA1124]
MTRIVAVCGSRREGSYTKRSLEIVLDAARDAGAETTMLDLGAVDLPLYHPDRDEQGESERLTRLVREADGVVVGSPVYHGSYSSTFRNFHDYCSKDEFEDTAVGLVATAGGGSYGATLEHMRSTIRGVHGRVVPEQVGVRGAYNVYDGDELTDEDVRRRLVSLAESVVEEARRLHPETARAACADD